MEKERQITRSNQLLHLSWKVHKNVVHHIEKTANRNGLTAPQYSILMMFSRKQRMNQKHVQEKTLLPKSTLSQGIDGLVKQGFLIRRQVEKNRREVELSISDDGKRLIDDMMIQANGVHQLFHQAIESLSDQQFHELLNAQELILNYFKKQGSDEDC